MAFIAWIVVASDRVGAQQQHATFQYGDIIACGQTPGQFFGFGRWEWYLPDGTLNLRMAEQLGLYPQDVALNSVGNAYFPTFFSIVGFDRNGRFFESFPRFSTLASSITFDRLGNAYIVDTREAVLKTSPRGDLLDTFILPVRVGAIDLAADQCALYYTGSAEGILRYDVCQDEALPAFANSLPGGTAQRVRILPDGGVLVTATQFVVRLDNAGTAVRTYDVAGLNAWFGLAIDVDGRSFWATSSDNAYRFDLENGDILGSFRSVNDRPSAGPMFFTAITIVGEPRAALAPLSIPALSGWPLVLLAISLVAVAVWRLR